MPVPRAAGSTLDIDFRVLTGGNEELYINPLAVREGISLDGIASSTPRDLFSAHLYRDLSYILQRECFIGRTILFSVFPDLFNFLSGHKSVGTDNVVLLAIKS